MYKYLYKQQLIIFFNNNFSKSLPIVKYSKAMFHGHEVFTTYVCIYIIILYTYILSTTLRNLIGTFKWLKHNLSSKTFISILSFSQQVANTIYIFTCINRNIKIFLYLQQYTVQRIYYAENYLSLNKKIKIKLVYII